jgi:hypothetical protein
LDGTLQLRLYEKCADAERLDLLTGFLRRELLELDVADVTTLSAGEPPAGTRAFDFAAVGGLLVTLGQSAQGLRTIISTIRTWMARGETSARSVRLEIDGDVLELSEVTAADQERLITLFVSKHSTNDDDQWTADAEP